MTELLALCRAGFEPECVQELEQTLGALGVSGYGRTERDSGLVRFMVQSGAELPLPPAEGLIFARSLWPIDLELNHLDAKDRARPMLDWCEQGGFRFADVRVECADSPAGEALRALCRGFESALLALLKKHDRIDRQSRQSLLVFLLSGQHALLGRVSARQLAQSPRGGIVRLRFPSEAPSRSTLKLEEAFMVLLSEAERERWLKPGMTAVDLGACPGGWTYQFVRRSIRVQAIDNGPMAETLMATGLVEHIRADGFQFRPRKAVDWLVCDMVEQPIRVANLIAEWLREGHCQRAIFNLKLPMKKRYPEVQRCLEALREQAGGKLLLRARQLYHDREEITVLAARIA